jgi:hypothetical protein
MTNIFIRQELAYSSKLLMISINHIAKNETASIAPSVELNHSILAQPLVAAAIANRKSQIVNSVDAIQGAIERMPQVELPLTDRFLPGIYIRTTQHPFVVTKGRCLVWDPVAGGAATIKAGHVGANRSDGGMKPPLSNSPRRPTLDDLPEEVGGAMEA